MTVARSVGFGWFKEGSNDVRVKIFSMVGSRDQSKQIETEGIWQQILCLFFGENIEEDRV